MASKQSPEVESPSELPIVIPSYRRAAEVTTTQYFAPQERLTLCVAEEEYEAYQEHNEGVQIVAHPNEVAGLAATRQWIYDRWGSCVMLDDDILGLANNECCNPKRRWRRLDAEESLAVLDRLTEEARQLGVFLFGISSSTDPTNYNDFKPYRLSGMVRGGVCGIFAGSKLWWPPEVLQEDVWLSALNAYYHRMALIDCRYSVVERTGGNFKNAGGLATYRNEEALRKDREFLKANFGPLLRDRSAKSPPATLKPGAKDKRTTRVKRVSESQVTYRDPFVGGG